MFEKNFDTNSGAGVSIKKDMSDSICATPTIQQNSHEANSQALFTLSQTINVSRTNLTWGHTFTGMGGADPQQCTTEDYANIGANQAKLYVISSIRGSWTIASITGNSRSGTAALQVKVPISGSSSGTTVLTGSNSSAITTGQTASMSVSGQTSPIFYAGTGTGIPIVQMAINMPYYADNYRSNGTWNCYFTVKIFTLSLI